MRQLLINAHPPEFKGLREKPPPPPPCTPINTGRILHEVPLSGSYKLMFHLKSYCKTEQKVFFSFIPEALELDLNLTRQEIITFLGQPANLGCYATTTLMNSSLSYSWTKDNRTVTQSSRVRAFDDVLVITPEEAADFGTYQCNITNGVSSILCRISLLQGLDKPGKCNARGRMHELYFTGGRRTELCQRLIFFIPL